MRPLVLVSAPRLLERLALPGGLDAEVRAVRELPRPAELDPERATVVLVDRWMLSRPTALERLPSLAESTALVAVCEPGESEPCAGHREDLLAGFIAGDATPRAATLQLRAAVRHAASLASARAVRVAGAQHGEDLARLARVGVALSTERNLSSLLQLIVSQARRLTDSDAASLYLVERRGCGAAGNGREAASDAPGVLRFRFAQNFTVPNLPLRESTVAIDHSSLAGHAALTGEPLSIADVARLPAGVPYRVNRSFDERLGYRTKSVLVIPMKTHQDEVIGVLQLINRKRTADARLDTSEAVDSEVLPFDERSAAVVGALAAQAAVAIENGRLYDSIERLFESFVVAAASAIDARDPATAGHSARVATLAVRLAESLERVAPPSPYAGVRFSREQLRELRYAALLHDFGKVAVREQLLAKQKKLYPDSLDAIRRRIEYAMLAADVAFERGRADFLLASGRARYAEALEELDRTRRRRRAELESYLQAVLVANEPMVLTDGTFDELRRIAGATYEDHEGTRRTLLTADEVRALSLSRGNLDDVERREVESHVVHTYRFLQQIPWTRELRAVPEIALAHHEKLDGSGYPHGVGGDAIPLEARIITVVDIFDALTASDRPYKRAVTSDYALGVLRAEAEAGMLDADLVEAFAAARVWEQPESTASAGA